jgi:hypothetical protein
MQLANDHVFGMAHLSMISLLNASEWNSAELFQTVSTNADAFCRSSGISVTKCCMTLPTVDDVSPVREEFRFTIATAPGIHCRQN